MYNDTRAISEYLHTKMEAQMGVVKPDEVSQWAKNISSKYGIPEQEVLDIMSRLTQFGSFSQLETLGKKLSDLNIGHFYMDSGVSANTSLHYIGNKKGQFSAYGSKTAFILDDAGLKYLESLGSSKRQQFLKDVEKGNVVLVDLDGTGLTIGNNSYSYTALDGGQNLEVMTEAVVAQMKNGASLDEVLNSNHKERIRTLFGDNAVAKIETIKINDSTGNSANIVAEQIKPNMPTALEIRATIEGYTKRLVDIGTIPPEKADKVKSLLAKYIDNMLKMNSNDTFMELLRRKHAQIEDQVKKMGKTMDDVIYVYPQNNKSYILADYMYAKVNGISPDKFMQYQGHTALPPGKVVVLLDDVVGSGDSMTKGSLGGFLYSDFIKNNPHSNIIFSPITCAQDGFNSITTQIKNAGKGDALIFDNSMIADFSSLASKLSTEDTTFLLKALGDLGYKNGKLCTSFQYMVPDNCTAFAGALLNFNLNNHNANKLKEWDPKNFLPNLEAIYNRLKELSP